MIPCSTKMQPLRRSGPRDAAIPPQEEERTLIKPHAYEIALLEHNCCSVMCATSFYFCGQSAFACLS